MARAWIRSLRALAALGLLALLALPSLRGQVWLRCQMDGRVRAQCCCPEARVTSSGAALKAACCCQREVGEAHTQPAELSASAAQVPAPSPGVVVPALALAPTAARLDRRRAFSDRSQGRAFGERRLLLTLKQSLLI